MLGQVEHNDSFSLGGEVQCYSTQEILSLPFLLFHKLYHTHSKETVVSLNCCINYPSIVSQIMIICNVAVQLIILIIIFVYLG